MVTKRKRKRGLLAATRVRLLKGNLTRKLVRRERFVPSGGLSTVQLRQKITEMQALSLPVENPKGGRERKPAQRVSLSLSLREQGTGNGREELTMAIRSGETDRTLNLIKKLMLMFVM